MKKEQKDIVVAQIGEYLSTYPHFYLVNLTGLNASATGALRRKCFKNEIKLVMVKNTLLKLALDRADVDFTAMDEVLKGNTALMLCQTANAPAKLLSEYKAQEFPALKAAYAEEGIFVGADKLDDLVHIKSKNELIGDVVALLQSPTQNVLAALQSGAHTIHGVLKTLGERTE